MQTNLQYGSLFFPPENLGRHTRSCRAQEATQSGTEKRHSLRGKKKKPQSFWENHSLRWRGEGKTFKQAKQTQTQTSHKSRSILPCFSFLSMPQQYLPASCATQSYLISGSLRHSHWGRVGALQCVCACVRVCCWVCCVCPRRYGEWIHFTGMHSWVWEFLHQNNYCMFLINCNFSF